MDTLVINYSFRKNKCCNYSDAGYGKLNSIIFNGKSAINENGVYIFKK